MMRIATIHRRLVVRAAAVTSALLLLTSCGLWIDSEDMLERAQKARGAGDLRAALVDLRTLLRKDPQMLEARVALGEVSLEMGDVASAIRELELARNSSLPVERIGAPLARAYLAGQRAPDALELLDSVPTVNSDANLSALRGTALLALGRAPDAKHAFENAVQLDPKSVDALLGLASALAVEDISAALATTDRALELAPQVPRVRLARGALQMLGNHFALAEQEFRAAVELAQKQSNPTYVLAALASVAESLLARNEATAALEVTTQLQKLAPKNAATRYLRARALFQAGKPDEARPLLEQNLSDNAHDTSSRLLLGAVKLELGDLRQAEMYLSSVVAAEPDNVSARRWLAETRLRQSKPGAALDAIAPVLDKPDASRDLLALAGRASLAAGATASGLQYLERGAKMQPADVGAQLDLIAGYVAAGQFDEARAVLDGLPADSAVSARRTFLQVITQLGAGDAKAALDSARAAATAAPDDPTTQALAGAVYAQAGQFAEAKKYLQRMAALTREDATSQVSIGRVELLEGNVAAARQRFERALQKEPGHPGASIALAQVLVGANESARALKVLEAARKVNPNAIEVGIFENELLIATGDTKAATALASALVNSAPERAEVYAAQGRALAAAGQHDQSVGVLTAAERRLPRSAVIRYELARTLAANGQNQAAADAARAVLELEPRHLATIELLGRLAIQRSDWTEAQQRSQQLLQLAPQQARTQFFAGDVLLARKDYAAAAAAYRKAGTLTTDPLAALWEFEALRQGGLPQPLRPLESRVEKSPNAIRTRIMLADAQQKLGLVDAAAGNYERILRQQPDNVVALNNLAWFRHQKGDASALDLARRAHEREPRSREITDTYAWILVQRGQIGDGLSLLAPIAGPSAPPEVRLHYAVALARSGKKAQAQAIVDSVSKLPPSMITASMRDLIASASRE
jgi:putative PEP-CTERM system TPR-repeat lipoprotein